MKNTTQYKAIAASLIAGHKITPLDALRRWGCFRLGARIWELRRDGLSNIRTDRVTVNGKSFAQYYLP